MSVLWIMVGAALFLVAPVSITQSWLWLGVGLVISIGVAELAERIYQVKDDSRIVIDEMIGVWVALFGFEPEFGLPFVLAFVLFRFFDVIKGPWGRALQKLKGGLGVVLDDVVAGLLAAGFTRAILVFVA